MIYYIALKDGTKKLVAYEYKKYITFNNDYFHVCPEFKKMKIDEDKEKVIDAAVNENWERMYEEAAEILGVEI